MLVLMSISLRIFCVCIHVYLQCVHVGRYMCHMYVAMDVVLAHIPIKFQGEESSIYMNALHKFGIPSWTTFLTFFSCFHVHFAGQITKTCFSAWDTE